MSYSRKSQKKYRMCVKPKRIIMYPSNPMKGRVKKCWLKRAKFFLKLIDQLIKIASLYNNILVWGWRLFF